MIDLLYLFYKKILSPFLRDSQLFPGAGCRYAPTCSEYTKLAIKKYGIFPGLFKGLLRFLRCNPLFPGGIDYP